MYDGNCLPDLPLDVARPPGPELPRQHAGRPHLLANALEAARCAAPDLAALAKVFLPLMPRRPRASQNLRAITRNPSSSPFLLDEAITLPWCAVDSATHRNAVLIDIDHDDALDRWLELPEHIRPILVLDPWSGRAHAIAPLAGPVLLTTNEEIGAGQKASKKALLGPQMLADLAGRLLAAALGGTLLPPGSLVKSPWGQTTKLIGFRSKLGQRPIWQEAWNDSEACGLMWSTRAGAGPLELRDLVGALANRWWHETAGASVRFSAGRYTKKRGAPSWLSRNTWVFDLTRWWAYDRAERDTAAITEAALGFNSELANPLPPGDVHATAKSIGRFMATRFRPRVGLDEKRGRDREAGADLSPTERKALAGARTAKARAAETDRKIAAAVATLTASGEPVTQASVAAAANLGLNTVARRWQKPVLANPPNAALSGSAGSPAPGPLGPAKKPKESLPSSCPQPLTLSAVAARDRAIRRTIAALAESAAAARRPGAVPVPLPTVPPDLAADPALRAALRAAESAAAAARRRAVQRKSQAEATARRSTMVDRLRADASAAWRWWRQQVVDMNTEWDARESGAAEGRERELVHARRKAVIRGRWRTWKAALADVAEAVPDEAIPW